MDRQTYKGRPGERGRERKRECYLKGRGGLDSSSWKMADSFLVQERGVTEAKETLSPFLLLLELTLLLIERSSSLSHFTN